MSKSKSVSITVEQAIAAIINLDYIPDGLTVLDMTEAFLEVAEVDYENAKIERLSEDEISRLKDRFDICAMRHSLAEILHNELRWEIEHEKDSQITIICNRTTGEIKLEFESFSDWVYGRYGVAIHRPAEANSLRWDDVTIKIYKNYRIGCILGKKEHKKYSFQDLDLMGRRKLEPNQIGGILIGLSKGEKYPASPSLLAHHKTAISKLRSALKKLTGITDDPFFEINPGDGWKPKFKLLYDTRNADERAKRQAIHVSYDEAMDFEDEDDDAGRFIEASK